MPWRQLPCSLLCPFGLRLVSFFASFITTATSCFIAELMHLIDLVVRLNWVNWQALGIANSDVADFQYLFKVIVNFQKE